MSSQNSLILLRGLPGSGKSLLADVLSESGKYKSFSVDQYFTDEKGNYEFDFSKNHIAYDVCIRNVQDEMKKNASKIFVDNTFTMDWEMEPYFKLASENNYRTFVVTVENYHGGKNIHGIPDEQMRKMADKYNIRLLPSNL